VGVLSNVEPLLLQKAFEEVVATDHTEFKEASLEVTKLEIIIHCLHCDTEYEVHNYKFFCSNCQRPSNNIIQGNELLISGVEFRS
jgi:hydrogenase nickel incorporation protein HypA/HybF